MIDRFQDTPAADDGRQPPPLFPPVDTDRNGRRNNPSQAPQIIPRNPRHSLRRAGRNITEGGETIEGGWFWWIIMPGKRPPIPPENVTISQEPQPASEEQKGTEGKMVESTTPETTTTPTTATDQPDTVDDHTARNLTLIGTPGALEHAIDMDLARSTRRTREQVVSFLQRTAMGDRFIEASETVGISWNQFRMLAYTHPKTMEIYEFCKDLGKPIRQCRREMELDRRGNIGVRSPVYYKGKVVGYVYKPSDKCLELALKGGDTTGKYADRQKVETTGQAVVYHIHGVERTPVEKLTRPKVLDV